MEPKKYLLILLVTVLFYFYYTYFRVTMTARKRLAPFARAIKRML